MAVQNCIGDAFRGATWVALHNGGGVGWWGWIWLVIKENELILNQSIVKSKKIIISSCGLNIESVCIFHRGEVINGGFGLVLDGSEEAGQRARLMLNWDVSNGVSVCAISMVSFYSIYWYVYLPRWQGDVGPATLMLMRRFSVPWRTRVSWESPCPTQCRMNTFWTVHCRARLNSEILY